MVKPHLVRIFSLIIGEEIIKMKEDFKNISFRCAYVQLIQIAELNGGLNFVFRNIINHEKYQHFQPLPSVLRKGKKKAENYLRMIANGGDYSNRIEAGLFLDFTSEERIPRSTLKDLIGRVYYVQLTKRQDIHTKRIFENVDYILATEHDIFHPFQMAIYIATKESWYKLDEQPREMMMKDFYSYRSGFATRSFEEFKQFVEDNYITRAGAITLDQARARKEMGIQ